MSHRLLLPCLLSVATLAACSGGSANGPAPSRVDAAEALFEGLENLHGTAWEQMPQNGSASFTGVAGVVIDPVEARDDDDINIIGDARVTADFAAGTVTGRVTNMQGIIGNTDENPADEDLFDVTGRLQIGAISSGIGRNDGRAPNAFRTDIRGKVTTPDDSYFVHADLEGRFLGTDPNRAQPIKGLAALGDGLAIDSDGDDTPAYVVLGGRTDR